MASETIGQTNAAGPGVVKPQPVAMEIPVTVNGASTVAGSDKRQPFSETTQTVLVFGSGAVIRLAAAVGPGQLLFVTNEKSKQEVVCQVVKTKQNGSATGYVELKFTETTEDFWGIRAQGNGATRIAPVAPFAEGGVPSKLLEPKVAEVRTPPAAVDLPSPEPTFVPPAVSQTPSVPIAAASLASSSEIQQAPAVPAQVPGNPRVPTLSEFLTHGSNGLELKARDKAQPEKVVTTAVMTEERPPAPVRVAPRASGDSDTKPSLSVALGVAQNPAPGAASFDLTADLPAEEVKIPAWLEPLARNSAPTDSKPSESVLEASPVEENISAGGPATEETSQGQELVPALSAEGRAPNFGTSLALDSSGAMPSSGKGWKVGLAVAAALLAAAAIWYWYVNQPPKVSAGGNGTVAEGNLLSVPAPSVSAPTEPINSTATNASKTASSSTTLSQPAASLPVSTRTLGGNAGNESFASGLAAKPAAPSSKTTEAASEAAEAETTKKPALGKVHLAAPKITRSLSNSDSPAADPGLALSGVTPADSSGASLLSNKGKGPAAPLPVGGDVKVAQLISSVPPVYPQMARTQRVSGNVMIDALIDVNGRVSTMRVISGPALLHEAAMSSVRQWKYQPATLNGVPTATHLTVTVQFRLQ